MFNRYKACLTAFAAGAVLAGAPRAAAQTEPAPSPEVVLLSPPAGAALPGPLDVTLLAEVRGFEGAVSAVYFYGDGAELGSVGGPAVPLPPGFEPEPGAPLGPYKFVWPQVPPGEHTAKAVAVDASGLVVEAVEAPFSVLEGGPVTVVEVFASDPEGAEPDEVMELEFVRHGAVDGPLDVFFKVEGTAGAGDDYASFGDMATIPEGESSVKVVVSPLDDDLDEGTETILVTLLTPPCVAVFPTPPDCYETGAASVARLALRDNDAASPNRPPLVRLIRPVSGRSYFFPADIVMEAFATDADGTVASVHFFDGDTELGAGEPVAPGRFVFRWSDARPGVHWIHAVARDDQDAPGRSQSARVAVLEVERPAVVRLEIVDAEASEPTAGGVDRDPDVAVVEISRDTAADHPLEVAYRLGGRAKNGEDYEPLDGVAVIPAGEQSARLTFVPLADRVPERDETVLVALRPGECLDPRRDLNHACYVLSRAFEAELVIHDASPAPPVNSDVTVRLLSPFEGMILPDTAPLVVVADIDAGDARIVSAEVIVDGREAATMDHRGNGRSPIWQARLRGLEPGEHTVLARVRVGRREMVDSEPVNIRILPRARVVVQVSAPDPVASEGFIPSDRLADIQLEDENEDARIPVLNHTASWRLTRTGSREAPLTVFFELSGDAVEGADFEPLERSAVIPAGEAHVDVVLTAIDDREVEETEHVLLTVLPPVCPAIFPPPADCYLVGADGEAMVHIRDNDRLQTRAPLVTILEPESGDVFQTPASVRIRVEAVDPDGWTSHALFLADGEPIGEQSLVFIRPPDPGEAQHYEMVWDLPPAGVHILTVRVTDDQGASGDSEPVRVVVRDADPEPERTRVLVEALVEKTHEKGAREEPGVFQIWRKGDLTEPLEVFFTMRGSATEGADYQGLGGSVTIPAGEEVVALALLPIDDAEVEGSEEAVLVVEPPVCLAIFPPPPACYLIEEPGMARIRILDDDRDENLPPRVVLVRPSVNETFAPGVPVVVEAAATDPDGYVNRMDVYEGDRKIGSARLDFIVAPDPGLEQRLAFEWLDAPAGRHTIHVEVFDDQGGSARSRAVPVQVLGDRDLPVVTVHARDAYAVEPDGRRPANRASFRLRRRGGDKGGLTVRYQVSGLAENGVDYETLSGEARFEGNKQWVSVDVLPLGDDLDEGMETVVLTLVPGGRVYTLGADSEARVVIADADVRPDSRRRLKDGSLHFHLPAPKGRSYRLEATTHFDEWNVIETGVVEDDDLHFIHPGGGDGGALFFRVADGPSSDPDEEAP